MKCMTFMRLPSSGEDRKMGQEEGRCLNVVVLRHSERQDSVDPAWVARADRPWDPPLTTRGRLQAEIAGTAIVEECIRKGLSPPSELYSSPLTRCVETSRYVENSG